MGSLDPQSRCPDWPVCMNVGVWCVCVVKDEGHKTSCTKLMCKYKPTLHLPTSNTFFDFQACSCCTWSALCVCPASCLLCVTSCIAGAHLQHRAGTYQTLLWSSLRARSLLLTLLHKQKDPSVLQHCRQLSALLATTGLASTPDVRKLQMEVCRTCGTQQAFMIYFTPTVSYAVKTLPFPLSLSLF